MGGWTQHVSQPTRNDNILHLVFSTEDLLLNTVILPGLSVSDHCMIKCCLDKQKPTYYVNTRTYTEFNGID